MLILASLTVGAPAHSKTAKEPVHYLLVWAGDPAKVSHDFVAVVDADPASPTYGKLVTSIATDQKSAKPHHTEYEKPASGNFLDAH